MSRNNNSRNRTYNNVKTATNTPELFTFTHKGAVYSIPPLTNGAFNVKAGDVIDAIMDGGETADMRLSFGMLQQSGIDKASMDALRDKSFKDFLEITGKWMKANGANLGK